MSHPFVMHLITRMFNTSVVPYISFDQYLYPNLYTVPDMQNMRFFCCSVYLYKIHITWISSYFCLQRFSSIFESTVRLAERLFVCLFDLILYVPSTIFQLNRDGSSWVEPVLSYDKCVLLKDHNAVTLVRLEPAALRSRVKHCTIEPLHSLSCRTYVKHASLPIIDQKIPSS